MHLNLKPRRDSNGGNILDAPDLAGRAETRELSHRGCGAANGGCGSLTAHLDAIRKLIGGGGGVGFWFFSVCSGGERPGEEGQSDSD
jgi:hypothetical protein